VFGPVMAHPATVQALAAAHRELREVAEGELKAIAGCGEPIAANLVRLHRRVAELLAADWYDTTDLRRAAAAVLHGEPHRGGEIGEVVLFLPQELSPSATALLRELPAAGLRVVAGRTGEERVDRGVIEAVRGLEAGDGGVPVVVPVTATQVVTASDPDDEVRCVVRLLVDKLAEVPAHRVAVLYGASEPYARLLAEHLGAAGITANGTAVRPVMERAFPRALLGLLALPEHGWRRDEVLALLAGAPILGSDGRLVPVSRWERISRAAGVVAGGDWAARLAGYAAAQRSAAERERVSDGPREERMAALERDAEVADALRGFVAGLRGRVEAGAGLSSWAELAGWTTVTFGALFGDVGDESRLPGGEARAAETVARVVSGLAELGAVEPVADLTALGLTLGLELADDLPRQGRFGTGVLVAPLGSAIGLDVDVVFVVGLAEELVPGRLREDALLPERVRALAPGQLAPLRDRQHRQLLAALAAAPERIVSFPRGDLRRSSTRLPSRWLLPSLRALSGQPGLQATRWESVSGRWLDGSPSYAAGLTRGSVLPSEQEWRIRAVLAGRGAGMTVDEVLAGGEIARRAMARRALPLPATRSHDVGAA